MAAPGSFNRSLARNQILVVPPRFWTVDACRPVSQHDEPTVIERQFTIRIANPQKFGTEPDARVKNVTRLFPQLGIVLCANGPLTHGQLKLMAKSIEDLALPLLGRC